ncbi:uncharacterized protein NEMAJ01_1636 [Nematocida major]|uniref:uncharacterized protein n=1 Tax=Nematocida major TaxID=1912982 RepID=UPI0020077994|nr:uncharacterized protein NEMAJ01_1636 [Nematocida major]KAH9386740.1 hypothetical protein NEMAJ01_1636 [Nematocida major]
MRGDCFYFMTSTCARGDTCSYRHSANAKKSSVVCENWRNGLECDDQCPYRHSDYQPKEKPQTECYWEKNGGCRRPECSYVHKKAPIKQEYCLLDLQKLNYDLERLEIADFNGEGPAVVKTVPELAKELHEIETIFHI